MGSFRNRIVWIVVIALGVTLTSFLAVTRQEVNRQNMEMTRNLTEQIIEAKSAQISGWMEQRIAEVQVLTESELLRSMDMRRIKPYMRAFDAQHDEAFESFGICDEAGMMWISDDTMIDIGDREYFQRIQETGADFVISDPIISKSNEEPIVIIHHRIFGENDETLGHVNAAIRLSKLSELASEVVVEDGQGWLVDGSGHIFTPTQAGYEVTELEAFQTLGSFVVGNQQGVRVEGQDGQEGRLFLAPLKSVPGWQMGIVISEEAMAAPTQKLITSLMGLGGGILLIAVLLVGMIISGIFRPMNRLMVLMEQAGSGDLFVRFEEKRKDEIGQLGERFNWLLEQIQSLVLQVKEKEKEKQRAEMTALQAQIHPHFLYNTLDTIQWKALEYGADEAADMIQALSKFFRYSLNQGKEWTSLENEVQQIRNYLFIQKIRYEERLRFEIDCRADMNWEIPKLILQPLVENAIYHGTKPKSEGGLIRIEIREESMRLEIAICDTGIGMDPVALRKLRESIEGDGESLGIGMKNVQRRLQLAYGRAYGITRILSGNGGTRIELRIPKRGGKG
jgi:two-component system sensor histidine kinase YesM